MKIADVAREEPADLPEVMMNVPDVILDEVAQGHRRFRRLISEVSELVVSDGAGRLTEHLVRHVLDQSRDLPVVCAPRRHELGRRGVSVMRQ